MLHHTASFGKLLSAFGQHLETAFKMAAGENVNLNQVAPKLEIGLNDL